MATSARCPSAVWLLAAVAGLLPAPALAQQPQGQTFRGELTRNDPLDRIRKQSRHKVHDVRLEQGTAYLIDLGSTAFDPYLRVEDADGKTLAENDDISPKNLNSRLGFVPPRSGKYRLVVTSFEGGQTGAYALRVRPLEQVGEPRTVAGKLTKASPLSTAKQALAAYGLSLDPGRVYWLDLESRDLDLNLVVADGKGTVVARDAAVGGKARVLILPPEAAGYRFTLVAARPETYGAYRLTARYYALEHPLTSLEEEPAAVVLPEATPTMLPGWLTARDPLDPVRAGSRQRVHVLPLEKGKAYCLQLSSIEFTSFLRLEDDQGKDVTGATGGDARALFEPKRSGDYRLIVTTDRPGETGPFDLLVERFAAGPGAVRRHVLRQTVRKLMGEGRERQVAGDLAGAESYLRRALARWRQLYPEAHFKDGHPDLAAALNDLGQVLHVQGKSAEGERLFRAAVEMLERLYPATRYKEGHPHLAAALGNLGGALEARGAYAEAEKRLRAALAMSRTLYPPSRYKDGHRYLAVGMSNLAGLMFERGEYGEAERHNRAALEMLQRLYPAARFKDGHPSLAQCLNNLGLLLRIRGEYGPAEEYFRAALAMRERLYPPSRYPDGHPHLAESLSHMGGMLEARGEPAAAEKYYRAALAMYRKLHPASRAKDGHPDIAADLSNLGTVLQARGEHAEAEKHFRAALAMYSTLYPPSRCKDGHPDIATCLTNLAGMAQARGEDAAAEEHFRAALGMRQRLYPEGSYPEGHPSVAQSLLNLGQLLQARGKFGEAVERLAAAAEMFRRLAVAFAGGASEAEALNFLASFPASQDLLLTATVGRPAAEQPYAVLWRGRGALTRVLEGRGAFLRGVSDRDARRQVEELLDVRRRLARLLLAPGKAHGEVGRATLLRELGQRKEELEKKLAEKVPELARQKARWTASPADLVAALPPGAAFVDLVRYHWFDFKQQKSVEERYAAFVLRPGQPPRRVELGAAAAIEEALRRWRKDIAANLNSEAAAKLRELLWAKLEPHFAPGTDTVYFRPEGALGALPWAALPGKKGGILLEEYAVALVPHGPYLLEQLRDRGKPTGPGGLLVVGEVAYDQAAAPHQRPDSPGVLRSAERAGGKLRWEDLGGTAAELDAVLKLAERLAPRPEVLALRREQAGTAQVLEALPKARWAHLATHGFFAAPSTDERKALLDEQDFRFGFGLERRGVGARNPLTQSGLVLAGANLPAKDAEADRGILTAEALAGLDLRGLRLAVLSACETGLGEAERTGQGIFGLQRALHLGGCRDVIASLWRVDDEPTAALMAVFYHQLWEKGEPPLRALQQAQLALYRHPAEVAGLARARGPDLAKRVKRVVQPQAPPPEPRTTALVRHWAAFILSGPGETLPAARAAVRKGEERP